jgi:VCBS repeat-containing protein
MARFHVPFFEGVTPIKDPLLLKDTEATTCDNARLNRGHLAPWKGIKPEENFTIFGSSTTVSGQIPLESASGTSYADSFLELVPTSTTTTYGEFSWDATGRWVYSIDPYSSAMGSTYTHVSDTLEISVVPTSGSTSTPLVVNVGPVTIQNGFGSAHVITTVAGYANTSSEVNTKTIYRYANQWLRWDTFVDAVKTPVIADEWERLFYTGDGDPKYTYLGRFSPGGEANGFQLGVPAPNNIAPGAGDYVITATESIFTEDRYYVYTYVTPLGEEGPPSLPSNKVSVGSNEGVTVTFSTEELGDYNLGSGAFRRVYRTGTGTTSTEYQYVADVPIAELTFDDTKLLEELGEVIPSVTWDPPPHSNTPGLGPLQGIITLPQGYLAGFTKNILCFSEQYMPSAWPVPYRLSFDSDIVGLGVAGNSVIVLTKTFPYLVTGGSPPNLAAVRVESAQACVSKESIVDGGKYVIYASPDGLIGVSEAGVENLTEELLTREQWHEYNPASIVGLYYEDMYLGVSSTKAFIVNREGVWTDLPGFTIENGFNDLVADKLYILQSNGVIGSFNEGANLSLEWKSKTFLSGRPTSIGACRIDNEGSSTFRLYSSNDTFEHSFSMTDNDVYVFRTPAGVLSDTWSFKVTGTGTVRSVTMASTIAELTNV